MKVYTIQEYGAFISDKYGLRPGYLSLPDTTFRQLQDFVLDSSAKGTNALDIMALSAKKGVGTVLTAQNYVGVIALQDGAMIEILPKVCTSPGDAQALANARRVLLTMLKCLPDMPFKTLPTAQTSSGAMDIYEIFIRMFVAEVTRLAAHGLKCGYETIEENERFFKGKMLFSKQIKYNCTHKERSYIAYDAFTPNRAENCLIKATLLLLYRRTNSSQTREAIKALLDSFAGVTASTHWKMDFARCTTDRSMREYRTVLCWCRLFLLGNSFSPTAGRESAWSLLFPMDQLYERAIAVQLQKKLQNSEYRLTVQDTTVHLFDMPQKDFQLRPDLVVTRRSDNTVFVLDTKWKLLDQAKRTFGIAQADMYQMFAYQKKYGAKCVILLYPQTELVSADTPIRYTASDGVDIYARFVDLMDIGTSLAAITRMFE